MKALTQKSAGPQGAKEGAMLGSPRDKITNMK